MNISMGFDPRFNMGSIDIGRVQRGISRACRIEVESYAKICNVNFTGSTKPMIYFKAQSMANYWGLAYPGRRVGTGTIVYSNHPRVVQAHNEQTLLNLPFHELWHCLAPRPHNKSESVNYPPSQWAIDLLVRQYGQPTAKAEHIPSDTDSMIHRTSFFGRWLRWLDTLGKPVVFGME